MTSLRISLIAAVAITGRLQAEKMIRLEQLPAPVQKTVKEQTQNAKMVGLSKEKEGGKTVYELETSADGKARDLTMDATGAILLVEQEVTLESLPPAAKSSLEKKVGTGKITKVETITKGSDVAYEAAFTTKSGKKAEYVVNADGTPHK